jgi:hypothetical protein
MTVNCSFCGNEIKRDRYNLTLKIERQDHPPSGNWSKGYDFPREDICKDCVKEITRYYGHILDNIRKNKGKYK